MRAALPSRQGVALFYQQAGLLRHLGRGLVRLGDELLDRLARNRRDLELRPLGFRQEIPVRHRIHKCLLQRAQPIRGNPGWSLVRPSHGLAREDEPEHLPLNVASGEVHDQRHVRQVGVLGERELHQQIELLLGQP